MGESKRPIYAYADETGKTGHNLFDEAQPEFFTAALVTKGDFDARFSTDVAEIAKGLGVGALHGRELGMGRIESMSDDFLRLLVRADAHFFVSRVEKRYLLATKIFDSLFDSGENAAVAWHLYNVRPLRLILAFKLASIVDEETARLFWQCILEPNEKKAYETLPTVCANLQRHMASVPDEASRRILTEGLEWARTHPESIQIHIDKKTARQGHFPNLVAFTNLLAGLDEFSKRWKKRVARITHDQQSEFETSLSTMHNMLSNASPEEFKWAGETHIVQKVVGSTFEVCEDSKSAGIQVADVVLWLYAQFMKGKELPDGCARIMRYVLAFGWQSDFSFAGVEARLLEDWGSILSTPLPPDKEEAARTMLAEFEDRRRASMAQYEEDGVPPFMRSVKPISSA